MLRRSTWEELGGLCEEFYPLWFEDVDYLKRLTSRGYRVRYVPAVAARHGGGHSIRKLSAGCRAVYWYGSLLRYASKYFSPVGCRLVCVSVAFASIPRAALSAMSEGSLKPVRVYARILRLAVASLLSGRVPGHKAMFTPDVKK
jgi:GT2 family glycosyltransferase